MNQAELFYPQAAVPRQLIATPQTDTAGEPPFRCEDIEPELRVAYTVRFAEYPHPAADAVKVSERRFRHWLSDG